MKKILTLITLLLLAVILFSCASKVSEVDFTDIFTPLDTDAVDDPVSDETMVVDPGDENMGIPPTTVPVEYVILEAGDYALKSLTAESFEPGFYSYEKSVLVTIELFYGESGSTIFYDASLDIRVNDDKSCSIYINEMEDVGFTITSVEEFSISLYEWVYVSPEFAELFEVLFEKQ